MTVPPCTAAAMLLGRLTSQSQRSWPLAHRCVVVLASSHFNHVFNDLGRSRMGYEDDPLAAISEKRRGMLLEGLARSMLERTFPHRPSQDAYRLLAKSDSRRRAHAEWDFTLGSRRVELKSAKLCFHPSDQCWRVSFFHVKLASGQQNTEQPFDDLYLLIYSPDAFHLVKHDLHTGVSSAGARTKDRGHTIKISGKHCQMSWRDALQTIMLKLVQIGACSLIGTSFKDDPLVSVLYSKLRHDVLYFRDDVYANVPMSSMSTVVRAYRVQQIACEVDKLLNPNSIFKTAAGELTAGGRRRGTHTAAVDWVQDAVRVEAKYAKVRFDPSAASWRCTFCNIKVESQQDDQPQRYFDELWLAMYSPYGLDIFKHRNFHSAALSRDLPTTSQGRSLLISGRAHDRCVNTALQLMNDKLEAGGAEHFVTIP